MGDRTGSIPVSRTKQIRECKSTPLFVCHGMWNLISHSNTCVRGSGTQIRRKDVPRSRGNSLTNLVREANLPVYIVYILYILNERPSQSTRSFLLLQGVRNLISHSNTCVRGSGAQIRQKDVPCSRGNSLTNLVCEANVPVYILNERPSQLTRSFFIGLLFHWYQH